MAHSRASRHAGFRPSGRLRTLIAERDGLGRKLATLERRVSDNTNKIDRVFDVLKDLLEPPEAPADTPASPRKIGFHPD